MRRGALAVGLALLLATLGVAWILSRERASGPLFAGLERARPGERPAGELARLGPAPDFSLRRSGGGRLATADLRGMVWVVDFIFTHCAAECPMMTTRLTALQAAIPADLPVRFLSISVDPDRDTPEVLAAYAERNAADRSRWFFATGPFPEIRRIAEEGFHLGVGSPDEDDDFQILHSNRFVLIDARGEIRGYYEGTDGRAVERLRTDILALVAGAGPGGGPGERP